jgi:cytochrome c-type biogenesis protein CcmH
VIRVILLGVVRLAVLLLFVSPALAVSDPNEMLPDRQQERRAEEIGHQLRCLVCQNESVEESDADLARDLRRIIRDRVKAGDSDQQVIDWMVARYGDFVRLRPPIDAETLLLWLAPVLALGVGVVAVVLLRRREAEPIAPLSGEERRQIASLIQPDRTAANYPARGSR